MIEFDCDPHESLACMTERQKDALLMLASDSRYAKLKVYRPHAPVIGYVGVTAYYSRDPVSQCIFLGIEPDGYTHS